MEQNRIRKIFKKFYNNQSHIMTPEIIRYGEIPTKIPLIFEISKGDFLGAELFAITFLVMDNGHIRKPETYINISLQNLEMIEKYISEIDNDFNIIGLTL